MESNKPDDVDLWAMMNNPAKFTPVLSVPDWNTPTTSTAASTAVNAASNMTVLTPNGTNHPYTNVTLQNCVATMDLGCQLNLIDIYTRTRSSEYNPIRFGAVMRIREPKSTALIFKSGKIICTGARNEQDALLASRKIARIIQKLGYNIKSLNFQIQNIVATCDLGFPIKLENLYQVHRGSSRYEPEVFPGLMYRLIKPRLVLSVFANGKIVFTGGKSREDIKDALLNMYSILKSFSRN